MTMIFVDADSCANKAKDFILQTAVKRKIKVIYAANRNIPFSIFSPLFKMEICDKIKNSADDFIFENIKANDIAVTRDLILAERIVKKNISVMNDKGTVFTMDNISALLEERELSIQIKKLGISTGGKWDSYSADDLNKFKESLCRLLEDNRRKA